MRSPRLVIRLSVVLLAALAGVACAPQGAQPSLELAAYSDRWTDALAAGDVDGLVALYTADCRILPPNAPMDEGHDAVRAVFSGMIEAGLTGVIKTIEATVSGDIGHKVGTYTLMAPDGSVVDRGKFMEAWKKTGDGWQMTTDIFNSDLPAPGSGPLLVATHDVKDGKAWLEAWSGEDGRHAWFAANGARSTRTFADPESPNQVSVLIEVADMDQLMAFLDSPEVATAKAEDGVIDRTIKFYAEAR